MYRVFCLLIFIWNILHSALSNPVVDGENVGEAMQIGDQIIVTGNMKYPYMSHISIYMNKDGQNIKGICGGIIIGSNAVLTVAHCLSDAVNPQIVVHVGVVDTYYEQNDGQKGLAKDYLIHENYESVCKMANGRNCHYKNDIAIIWTKENFRFGPSISPAVLNEEENIQLNEKGLILGWGRNAADKMPTMLQKGEMKIVSRMLCQNMGPRILVSNRVMCLAPAQGQTRAGHGDSGGPFVVDTKVYGLSSYRVYNNYGKGGLNLFTHVALYTNWIKSNKAAGPPKERQLPRKGSKRPSTNRPSKKEKQKQKKQKL